MSEKNVICPFCGKKLNLKTVKSTNFNIKLSEAENKIWCKNCERWIKFNLTDKKGG